MPQTMLLVDVLDAQTLKSVGELARAQMQKKFIARAAVKKQGFQAAQSGAMLGRGNHWIPFLPKLPKARDDFSCAFDKGQIKLERAFKIWGIAGGHGDHVDGGMIEAILML